MCTSETGIEPARPNGLCDWQCLSRGHWSRDFAYVVTPRWRLMIAGIGNVTYWLLYRAVRGENRRQARLRSQFPALSAAILHALAMGRLRYVTRRYCKYAARGHDAHDDRTDHDGMADLDSIGSF